MRKLVLIGFQVVSIACCFSFLAVIEIQQAQPTEYKVNDDVPGGVLNLRTGPGISQNIVVAIHSGVTGLDVSEYRPGDDRAVKEWCHVTWNGNNGWVSSCCISKVWNFIN